MRTSPSSSSTMSTSTTLEPPLLPMELLVLWVAGPPGRLRDPSQGREFRGHGLRRHRQGEAETRAAGIGGVEPDLAAEILDDLPGHGQADAGARVSGPLVQPLEDHEDPISVLGLDTDTVVGK